MTQITWSLKLYSKEQALKSLVDILPYSDTHSDKLKLPGHQVWLIWCQKYTGPMW